MEGDSQLDDDSGPSLRFKVVAFVFIAVCVAIFARDDRTSAQTDGLSTPAERAVETLPEAAPVSASALVDYFPVPVLIGVLALIMLSAFFSASEVAFFSIHRLRIRGLSQTGGHTGRLVSTMLERPGRLLTTILVGNMIVNVLISVVLPQRVQGALEQVFGLPGAPAYLITVLLCTAFLVYFGEITPKVFAVRIGELFARTAAVPMRAVDWLMGPVCKALIAFTNFIFRVTRFNDIKAAPFITDEEFKSLLAHGEQHGVIEEEEGQMIQGILEFSDAQLREILVPRPDIIALSEQASVREALELFRRHEFSRMPVYRDDLDHVSGILFAKDLLSSVSRGDSDTAIKRLIRPAHFVPETMTAASFVKDAQRLRMHLAIVVDEYGGTEGIVTLEDAIEEVVGEIQEEDKAEVLPYHELGEGSYRVDGNLPLDELSELIGIEITDEEHETIAGFLMDRTNKVLEAGDRVEHMGAKFTVESVDGKRASSLTIDVPKSAKREEPA